MITVKVNDTVLENYISSVVSTDGTMRITLSKSEDVTLDSIVSLFTEGAKVEIIDNDVTTVELYNRCIESIFMRGDNIILFINASELNESAENELTDRADTSDGAIEDLAAMLADIEARVTALEGNGTESKVEEASNG